MKTALIRQPVGLGDILYTHKIACKILERGLADKVIWPVNKKYTYLSEYIQTDGVTFISEEDNFDYKNIYQSSANTVVQADDMLYVPLQHADQTVPHKLETYNHPMYCKYELVGLDFSDWYEYINLIRNGDREEKLKRKLNLGSNYTICNRVFGTFPQTVKREIPKQENEYEIQPVTDCIFDWCGILEEADHIHTVDTAFSYLLVLLGCKNVTLYSRNIVSTKCVQKIHPFNWKYIDFQ